jgi:hypothetical protein
MSHWSKALREFFKFKRLISMGLSAFVLLALASPCLAQEAASGVRGYFFVAPGLRTHNQVVSGIAHFGGGADVFLFKGLAAEAEIGYLRPWGAESHQDLGMLSLSAAYHLRATGRFSRFVSAGVSLGLHDKSMESHNGASSGYSAQTLTLLNFGSGGTYWFTPRKGLRLEIRDHFYVAETHRHYLEFRLGLAIR